MVALGFSVAALFLSIGLTVFYARRRPVGTPTTWGEAMVGAVWVFAMLFLVYGIIPHQWLTYAGNELEWRKDKIGIPAGILGKLFGDTENSLISDSANVFFPEGVPLFSGSFMITAEAIQDIVVTVIYVVGLSCSAIGWGMWQRRGQTKPKALPTSAYGRPLIRPAKPAAEVVPQEAGV